VLGTLKTKYVSWVRELCFTKSHSLSM